MAASGWLPMSGEQRQRIAHRPGLAARVKAATEYRETPLAGLEIDVLYGHLHRLDYRTPDGTILSLWEITEGEHGEPDATTWLYGTARAAGDTWARVQDRIYDGTDY